MAYGSATITVTVNDWRRQQLTSSPAPLCHVNPVKQPPTLNSLADLHDQ